MSLEKCKLCTISTLFCKANYKVYASFLCYRIYFPQKIQIFRMKFLWQGGFWGPLEWEKLISHCTCPIKVHQLLCYKTAHRVGGNRAQPLSAHWSCTMCEKICFGNENPRIQENLILRTVSDQIPVFMFLFWVILSAPTWCPYCFQPPAELFIATQKSWW